MKKCRQPLPIFVLAILDGSQQNQGIAGVVCRLWDLSLLCCTIKQMLQYWSALCYILPIFCLCQGLSHILFMMSGPAKVCSP